MITRRGLLKLAGFGFACLAAAVAYPVSEVLARPRITPYRLTPNGWPKGFHLRACLVADIHACEPWMNRSRIEGICAQVRDLKPDIILLLGDYLSGMTLATDRLEPSEWAPVLGTLAAPLGVHAILGNHDYWEDATFQQDPTQMPMVVRALEAAGIAVYVNRAVRIEKEGRHFWLAGLGDQLALLRDEREGRSRMRGVDDLEATLRDVQDDAPVILLAHEPDIFHNADERVALTLSGHTHGGQINLFGWRPFSASPGSALYPAGVYQVDSRHLVVSRGLGCSAIPMRIGNRPELVVLELGNE
ncbi:metallophosphoesterase [Rhizobium halophilum]|uniref:metallophosphoesterase n=1 Tax=Rhizobium halophilum TaxID=2846852 RepID=UPI001EFD9160|nr:metallophosphoesterase [Rhizobium halophilum]MCF6367723.1 metallophosphoesterase [Rhizobium halophilum]